MSRLDMTECQLRRVRARNTTDQLSEDDKNENDNDNVQQLIACEDMAEDKRRQSLLLISSGPRLQCDVSPQKLDFLSVFSLTTVSTADGQSPSLLHQSAE